MRILLSLVMAVLSVAIATAGPASSQEVARGVTAYYYRSAEQNKAIITGPYDYKTIDPGINFGTSTWAWKPFGMDKEFSVYWNGWLYIDAKQSYMFGILASGGAELYIDEIKVVTKPEPPGKRWASGWITLNPGYHRVELIYYNWRGSAGVGLYWNLGSGFEPFPSARMFPEDAVNPEAPQNQVLP